MGERPGNWRALLLTMAHRYIAAGLSQTSAFAAERTPGGELWGSHIIGGVGSDALYASAVSRRCASSSPSATRRAASVTSPPTARP